MDSSLRGGLQIQRPADMGAFQFAVLATLRAAQLMRGCIPRVDGGDHKPTVVAQREVAAGKVTPLPKASVGVESNPASIEDASVVAQLA